MDTATEVQTLDETDSISHTLGKGMNPIVGQNMTQGQFLSGVQQVGIQNFPSPKLVASPRLKKPVCPTIYP